MRIFDVASVTLITGSLVALPHVAQAAMARGPGTEQTPPEPHGGLGIAPGLEVSAGIGTGFGGTYGLGYEGRVGYTLPINLYLGGQVQAFYGQGAVDQKAHAAYFGGEVGYKIFPIHPVELRPYLFLGPAFITQVDTNPTTATSKTGFAVQPGILGVYHIGPAFVGADFRFLATPSPFGVTLQGTAGLAL